MSNSVWMSVLLGIGLAACSAIPPPGVLAQLEEVRDSAAGRRAKTDAPAAFAVAERFRADAQAALDRDDLAGAQILGERALAAYEEAAALARVARADKSRERAAADANKLDRRLAELDLTHQQVAADIAAVEQRLKVLRSVEPVSPSGPAGPAREKARWQAVASLHLGARMLCAASRMLVSARKSDKGFTTPPEVDEGHKALSELDAAVAAKPAAAPIDAAMRARAECLKALTSVRRSGTDAKKASGAGDALLDELSKTGHGTATRDDRGVVVTLRNVMDKGELSASAKSALAAITAVGAKHAGFPVMVVLHQAKPLDGAATTSWEGFGAKIVALLRGELGEARVADPHLAGDAAPVVDPASKHSARNERIDIVFITPETF